VFIEASKYFADAWNRLSELGFVDTDANNNCWHVHVNAADLQVECLKVGCAGSFRKISKSQSCSEKIKRQPEAFMHRHRAPGTRKSFRCIIRTKRQVLTRIAVTGGTAFGPATTSRGIIFTHLFSLHTLCVKSGKKSVSKTHSEGEDRDARPTTLDRLTFLQVTCDE